MYFEQAPWAPFTPSFHLTHLKLGSDDPLLVADLLRCLFAHGEDSRGTLTHLDVSEVDNLDGALADQIRPLCPSLVWLALPVDDADNYASQLLSAAERLGHLRLDMAQTATFNALPATLRRLVLNAVEGAWGALAAKLPRLTALMKIDFEDTPPDELGGGDGVEDLDKLVAACAENRIECCFEVASDSNGWAG